MATAMENQMRHKVAQAAANLSAATLAAHEALERSGGDIIVLSPVWGALATMRRNAGMIDAVVHGGVRMSVVVTPAGWSSIGSIGPGAAVIKNSTVEEGPEVAMERGAAAVAAMLGL